MSGITLIVLGVIIYASRHQLVRAWELLGQADIRMLLLLIPLQFIVYFAGGEMVFSYLRGKKLIRHISRLTQTRIDLELNLVNHLFPSGGASGMSYVAWRLHKLGVPPARSTFAQVVRYVMGFVAYVVLMAVSLIVLGIADHLNTWVMLGGVGLICVLLGLSALVVHMFKSKQRMHRAAQVIARWLNRLARAASFGKVKQMVVAAKVEAFFLEMHDDFGELSGEKSLVIRPFLWGLVYSSIDVLMFVVTFHSLGITVDPAVLMIGYGVAGLAGLVAFTPGGAGVHETIMILFLQLSGVDPGAAIAGIVLTRAILLTGTIVFGYLFYQHALLKYGTPRGSES